MRTTDPAVRPIDAAAGRPGPGPGPGPGPAIVLPGARQHQDATGATGAPAGPPTNLPSGLPSGLPTTAAVDDADSPRDVLDLLILDAFTVGRQPYARSTSLENVRPDAALAPASARLLREAIDGSSRVQLFAGDGWTLRSTYWSSGRRADLLVTALTHALAETVLDLAARDAVVAPPPVAERVSIGFWHASPHGPQRRPRDIDAPEWPDIRRNYTARVAASVDALATFRPEPAGGRLLLLHGPPGTGKTTLLRALARRWRSWCQVDCVLDPERLFTEPGYLLDVALGVHGQDGEELWRLLLLEDCDELIRAEAKASTGQALSRLLNLTDGLLGQGRNVLIAITTNEDLTRLHPAVVRPGRSLAHLEVGRLTPAESLAWLAGAAGEPAPGLPEQALRDGATLAELFALRSGRADVTVVEPGPAYGCYL